MLIQTLEGEAGGLDRYKFGTQIGKAYEGGMGEIGGGPVIWVYIRT
jgi:hypothetical protein